MRADGGGLRGRGHHLRHLLLGRLRGTKTKASHTAPDGGPPWRCVSCTSFATNLLELLLERQRVTDGSMQLVSTHPPRIYTVLEGSVLFLYILTVMARFHSWVGVNARVDKRKQLTWSLISERKTGENVINSYKANVRDEVLHFNMITGGSHSNKNVTLFMKTYGKMGKMAVLLRCSNSLLSTASCEIKH